MTARRTDTQSIEVDADPADVLALLAAVRRLLEWAHSLADTVEPADGASRWTASKDGHAFPLRVLVHEGSRTVDYLPGHEVEIGGHTQVLPRPGGGAVVLFTQSLPYDADGADAARAAVSSELHALRALLDHQPPPAQAVTASAGDTSRPHPHRHHHQAVLPAPQPRHGPRVAARPHRHPRVTQPGRCNQAKPSHWGQFGLTQPQL